MVDPVPGRVVAQSPGADAIEQAGVGEDLQKLVSLFCNLTVFIALIMVITVS